VHRGGGHRHRAAAGTRPFDRAVHDDAGQGHGPGLAIVKKIVEEHFGSIEFEDAPGGGTLIRLAFDTEALARLRADAAPSEEQVASD
jgi:signal transduction histidine kinase